MKELRDHQKLILEEIVSREENNVFSTTILDLICGGGKSLIIAKLCKESEYLNIIIVNKYSFNQWCDLLNKEEIEYNKIKSIRDKFDKNKKINLVLDQVYNNIIDNTIIYERVVIDEVSPFIQKNITTKSMILLSTTYKEINNYMKHYDNISSIDYMDYNLYDFYFNSFESLLLESVKKINSEFYSNHSIEFLKMNDKKKDLIKIINTKSISDKLLIFTNNVPEMVKLLERRLIKFLIIAYDLSSDGIKKIQNTFNSKHYDILVINTNLNINGISFSMANKAILYDKFDEITETQCLGRIIRMTNKKNIKIYSA